MKLQLLGTGAADGIPAFFSTSDLSEHARRAGGKDIRTRTGAIVDDVLKIDFGPDTYVQAVRLGVRPSDWRWVAITHSHYDHLDAGLLQYCLPPFLPDTSKAPEVLGNAKVISTLRSTFEGAEQIAVRELETDVTVRLGDHFLTPIAAYHKLDEHSFNFVIEARGSRLLYATDTGVYQEATWESLKGTYLDCVVLECTDGFNPSDYWGHLSCEEVRGMVDSLRDLSCVDDRSTIVTTHHGDNGGATHAQLEEYFSEFNIQVGFDGMTIEF